ncbi:MAG: DUF6259 domain-containing protein [Planctomycetota bacterium]
MEQPQTPPFAGTSGAEFSGWDCFTIAFGGPNAPDDPSTTSDDAYLTQGNPGAIITSACAIYHPFSFSAYLINDSVPNDLQDVHLQTRTLGNPLDSNSAQLRYVDGGGGVIALSPASVTDLGAASGSELYFVWDLSGISDTVLSYEIAFLSIAPNTSLDAVHLHTFAGFEDCNGNGVPDECDLLDETSPDCDGNGVPDECDIAAGTPPGCSEFAIGNGVVSLTLQQDDEFGLVYKHLVNLAAPSPVGAQDGIFFAPTDLWKVTLHDTAFSTAPVSTSSPCLPQPADGLVHIRASEVLAQPVITTLPEGPGVPSEMRAKWTVSASLIEELEIADEDLALGFPLEPFAIELIVQAKPGDDFLTLNTNVRLLDDSSQLSVYRVELRAAAALTSPPEHQLLAVPWYYGVLLPNPTQSEVLELADCLADVRLSDPVYGKNVATHPGAMSMQWMSFYETDDVGDDLLFWGTRDTGNHIKPYLVYPEPNGLGFGVQYHPDDNLVATGQEDADLDGVPDGLSMPFDVVMTALKGDWYDAAQYYRDWAVDDDWVWIPNQLPGTGQSTYSDVAWSTPFLGSISLAECDPPPLGLPPDTGMSKNHGYFQYWERDWIDFKDTFLVQDVIARPWFWDANAFDASFGQWFPAQPDFISATTVITEPWAPYFHPLVLDPDASAFQSSYIPGLEGQSLELLTVRDEFNQPHRTSIDAPAKNLGCGPNPVETWQQEILCPAILDPAGGPVDTIALAYAKHVIAELEASLPVGATLSGCYLDEYHNIERVCFSQDHGHPVGGDGTYFVDGKQVLASELKTWMADTLNISEPFLWIEGASERYLALVEIANLSYGGVFGSDLEEASFVRAPMFQTVYNEYQRFASVLPVNLPLPSGIDSLSMAASRHFVARYAHESGEVPMGTVLSPTSLMDNLNDPDFALVAQMVTGFVQVLKTDEARDLVRFGQRFRNPEVVVSTLLGPSGPPPTFGGKGVTTVPVACREPGDGAPQYPPVYASASGVAGTRVAFLLVNWTAAQDLCLGLVQDAVPGPQSGLLRLDPQSYGFPAGAPLVLTNTATGAQMPLSAGAGPVDVGFELPQLSANLYLLEWE